MYSISIGTRGQKPPQSFGADRFDDDHAEERNQKLFYFNWWNIALSRRLFLGTAVIVYIEDSVLVAAMRRRENYLILLTLLFYIKFLDKAAVLEKEELKPVGC
ncbi:hypothetical protein OIU79_005009 [Salix purpurea]|uniref:Uncharacterized protein n=1 Tax=Salix purpurea TaxID=77065 RepID=A0A9Q0ZA76_SALPP|nr:hypothetical protein OIU79_005009 [Salix purpurea]